ILRSLSLCESPAIALNISGKDTVTVAAIAKRLGEFMGKTPNFSGTEADSALLSNVSKSKELLGSPEMALDTVLEWTAHGMIEDKPLLGKATQIEVRDGKYYFLHPTHEKYTSPRF